MLSETSRFYGGSTIADAEKFPFGTLLEEKLADDIDAKRGQKTIVKRSRLIQTISSELVLVVVIRSKSNAAVVSRSCCLASSLNIFRSDDSITNHYYYH